MLPDTTAVAAVDPGLDGDDLDGDDLDGVSVPLRLVSPWLDMKTAVYWYKSYSVSGRGSERVSE